MDSPKQMMNDYWHIPRASLTSSAASSSAASLASSSNRSNRSSHSNPATVHTMAKNFANFEQGERKKRSEGGVTNNNRASNKQQHSPPLIHQIIHEKSSKFNTTSTSDGGGKRNSSSSQGSSKSNNSTRSAASGSLLLTAANLERFAEIHKKQEKTAQKQLQQQQQNQIKRYLNREQKQHESSRHLPGRNYNSNLVQALENGNIHGHSHDQGMEIACITTQSSKARIQDNMSTADADAVITMDPNLDFVKTKNLDTISIASSMHFTMVNGEGGSAKKVKRGLCDRGRQVTVLIISMSTLFMLLIMGMVYALEMRAREMPQS